MTRKLVLEEYLRHGANLIVCQRYFYIFFYVPRIPYECNMKYQSNTQYNPSTMAPVSNPVTS